MAHTITRRDFLRDVGAGAAVLAGGSLLAGCGSSSGGGGSAGGASSSASGVGSGGASGGGGSGAGGLAPYPAYVPYSGVQADLAGNAQGLDNGYLEYPKSPVKATSEKPASGGSLTAMTLIYAALPTPLAQNQYWQQLNDRLGLSLSINAVTAADYDNKFATVIASGDLPDSIMIKRFPSYPAGTPQLLEKLCQDLTEFVSGDAIKEYPFLANIPTESWKECRINGKIYCLPIQRPIPGTTMFKRQDIISKLGLDGEPKSYADFADLCAKVTDKNKNRWALANPTGIMNFIQQMLGVGNNWTVKDGKFTSSIEAPETKQAISDVIDLTKKGVLHPDAFANQNNTVKVKQLVFGGNVVMTMDGFVAWSSDVWASDPKVESAMGAIIPPKYNGGGSGACWSAAPNFSITALKKGSKTRIQEVLRVMNYLACPFGTEEYLFRKYGIAGRDYTLNGTNPSLTTKGSAETSLTTRYMTDSPLVLYAPGLPDVTKAEYKYEQGLIPTLTRDPTIGLFSDTSAGKGASLNKAITDAQSDIFQGRKALSDWDGVVKSWRNNGGDTIRSEYEKAYAAANS